MASIPPILTVFTLMITLFVVSGATGATGASGSSGVFVVAAADTQLTPSQLAVAAEVDRATVERLREALSRRDRGDLAGAIEKLELMRYEPTVSLAVLATLGSLYLDAGRPADALSVLASGTTTPDPDPEVLLNAARAALALGKTAAAEHYLNTAVARSPVSRAAMLLSQLLTRQERHAEAAAVLAPLATEPTASKVEAVDPQLAAEVALRYARALIADGSQKAAAIVPLQRRIRLRPGEEESWRLLGDVLLEKDRFDEAREALASAQQIAEDQRNKEIDDRAKSADPGLDVGALIELATARRSSGDLEGALEAMTSAVQLAPRAPRPRMLQIQLLLALGRTEQALPRAERLVELAGGHPWAIYLRGMSRLGVGDPVGAENDLREVLELDSSQLPAMNGLATLLMRRGDLNEAAELSQRALKLEPNNPIAASNLKEIDERRAKGALRKEGSD